MHGTTIAAASGASGSALRQFAAELRWRNVFGRSCSVLLRCALLLAVPVVLAAWLRPSWCDEVLMAGAAVLLPIVAVAAVRAWWRGRHMLAALRTSLRRVDGGAALQDELVTWFEFDVGESGAGTTAGPTTGTTARAGMLRWLERDVLDRLAPHRSRALAAAARPRIGRWRWLLVVVVLLVVLWLLALWLAPPWSGAVGGRPNQPVAGDQAGGGGKGGGGEGGGSEGDHADADQQQPGEQQPDEQQPDEQQPDEQGAAGQPPPPAPAGPESANPSEDPPEEPPMVDVADDRRFVLPDFIGDGPTRRARMHAAELEEQVSTARQQNAARVPVPADRDPSTATRVQFERAAEAAQRSRHVPPAERAMVRRFFDKLRAKGR